jgi:hypothetical protein
MRNRSSFGRASSGGVEEAAAGGISSLSTRFGGISRLGRARGPLRSYEENRKSKAQTPEEREFDCSKDCPSKGFSNYSKIQCLKIRGTKSHNLG